MILRDGVAWDNNGRTKETGGLDQETDLSNNESSTSEE
jgi:hypothetical protein